MKKMAWFILCCYGWAPLRSQQQTAIDLLSNKNDYPSSGYNDIWGFVDANGREYAVLGTQDGTVVYGLENPRNPTKHAFVAGSKSIWRDMKSYAGFVYVVADQGVDGILAIDMRQAPDSISWRFHRPALQGLILRTCHNLYIDEKGFMYLSGCNINNGGVLLFDVATTPGTPVFLGVSNTRYSHDNFARGDTLWSADVYEGQFSVLDVTNKQRPRLLATQATSGRFTHNCWLSDDGTTLFTTDEKTLGTVDAYDITDLSEMRLLDQFMPASAASNRAIPHNVHYHNGYLATSWYTEGVVLTDAHRPENLVEIGRFDTYTGGGKGFYGCWGAYPFLPSGMLLASDIQSGLFVLQPSYRRACYLEGSIRDADSGAPIAQATIVTRTGEIMEHSNAEGVFRGGRFQTGRADVIIAAKGYQADTVAVELNAGIVTVLEVQLQRTGIVTASNEPKGQESLALHLFPNPTSGSCVVELTGALPSASYELEFRNTFGQQVARQFYSGNREVLTLDFPSGWYSVNLYVDGVLKVVKPLLCIPGRER